MFLKTIQLAAEHNLYYDATLFSLNFVVITLDYFKFQQMKYMNMYLRETSSRSLL